MLDTVDDCRSVGTFQNIHDPLEAQEVAAAMLGERLKQEGQRYGTDRLFAQDCIGIDVVSGMGMTICDGSCPEP